MSAPSVKEVLALSRAIDAAEQERAAAAQRKAELTAKLEALIGIAAEAAPVPVADLIVPDANGQPARKRKMPAIQTEEAGPGEGA